MRHELDTVRNAGPLFTFPGYVTPARLHKYHGVLEGSAGDVHYQEQTFQMAYESNGQSWSPQDLQLFQKVMGVSEGQVTELNHNGNHPSSCTDSGAQCDEANLDVQQLSGMSPFSSTS